MAQNDGQIRKDMFAKPTLTFTSTVDKNGVGAIMWKQQNAYRWVQNKHGSALTVGQVCFHADGDAANFFEKVYDGATGDLSFMAGVVQAASLAADSYGWIQIYGYYASISMYASGGTAIAVGDSLKGVNAKTYVVNGAATGTAPVHVRRIIALEALASSVTVATAKKGIIACL